MSDSDTCSCHIHWIFQDNCANVWWPEPLSSDDTDQDESPSYGVWCGGWLDGWNGRPGGRLDRLRTGFRDGRQVNGSVSEWGETPSSSFRRTPPMILVHLEKCCRWHNVPDGVNGWYTSAAHAIHHDHHGYIINGSSDSVVNFSGGLIDCGQTGTRGRASSSRRYHPRIFNGTELF